MKNNSHFVKKYESFIFWLIRVVFLINFISFNFMSQMFIGELEMRSRTWKFIIHFMLYYIVFLPLAEWHKIPIFILLLTFSLNEKHRDFCWDDWLLSTRSPKNSMLLLMNRKLQCTNHWSIYNSKFHYAY